MAKKITELTELTTAESSDVIPIVDDPSGTPVSKKIQVARLVRPWPDIPPSSPNTEDDEFESTTLNAKWTETTDAANHDHHTTWPSCTYINFTASQNYVITQDYAPAGAFSLTIKAYLSLQSNYHGINLGAYDDDESEAVNACWQWADGVGLKLDQKTANTWSWGVKTLSLPNNNHVYLHLQRDGSNNWGVWCSYDGVSFWICQSTYSKTFTVHHLKIQFSSTSIPTRGGIDWVRRDWITL